MYRAREATCFHGTTMPTNSVSGGKTQKAAKPQSTGVILTQEPQGHSPDQDPQLHRLLDEFNRVTNAHRTAKRCARELGTQTKKLNHQVTSRLLELGIKFMHLDKSQGTVTVVSCVELKTLGS